MAYDVPGALTGETIVCMAPDPWHGLWRNRHHIMTRLARRNLVLYVEPRVYLWEALRRFRTHQWRLSDLRRPLAEHYQDGLYVYHDPYYAPFAGRLSGGPLTAALRRRALRATLAKLGGSTPILWLLRPYQADQIGRYGEKLVVYHVTDEYSAYPSVTDRAAFWRAEEALLRRADLVIVTAPGLLASRRPFNPHTYLVPNAVDYGRFQQQLAGPWSQPERMAGLPHPRLGYVGALNEKVDYGLLAQVAREQPSWHIVLVGLRDLASQPHKADVLDGLPNVHWLGTIPATEVPYAIASLDVCLLPYERNLWTANIDSLKLYEYLACGRPVVSTDVPTAHLFEREAAEAGVPLVRIADSPQAFAAQIAAALAESGPEAAIARQRAAAANTWEQRVVQIERLLVEALARKGAKR